MPPDPHVMFLPRPRLKIPTSPSVPELAAVRFHAHRLRGIFDDDDAARLAQRANAFDVRRDPEQVMGDDTQACCR